MIRFRCVSLCLAVLLMAASPEVRHGEPVTLTAQPGTALDQVARQLVADELAEADKAGDAPLVLLGTAPLGGPRSRPALFIQLQSARECGSSGCSSSVYVKGPQGWRKVLDSVTGKLVVDAVLHRGMHDLIVDGHDRWIWNGTGYVDTRPAPAVNLAPRNQT